MKANSKTILKKIKGDHYAIVVAIVCVVVFMVATFPHPPQPTLINTGQINIQDIASIKSNGAMIPTFHGFPVGDLDKIVGSVTLKSGRHLDITAADLFILQLG